MINATLTRESPLRAVFPDGVMPLVAPGTRKCRLGGDQFATDCYFLAVRQCSHEQRMRMAAIMSSRGQGTYEQAVEHLSKFDELPIRASHVSSVGIPLRAFI